MNQDYNHAKDSVDHKAAEFAKRTANFNCFACSKGMKCRLHPNGPTTGVKKEASDSGSDCSVVSANT